MQKKRDDDSEGLRLSRRDMIAGAAATALVVGAPTVMAATRKPMAPPERPTGTTATVRRFMAAAAMMGDGRVLITGGYGQPWTDDWTPPALTSTMIFDPRTGIYLNAAPMRVARARHAAVMLGDGRVAVLGGIGQNPTSSVEIYDPRTNTWEVGEPLAGPRYDHTATSDGYYVYVMGGTAQNMVSGVEYLRPVSLANGGPQ